MAGTDISHLLSPYHIDATEVSRLGGYSSANYLICDKNGDQYVLKHYTDPSDYEITKSESSVIKKIFGSIPCELPVFGDSTLQSFFQYEDKCFSRLMPFMEGKLLKEVGHTPGLMFDFGRKIAHLDTALLSIRDPTIENRKSQWDMQHALWSKPRAIFIKDAQQRKLINYFLDQFEHNVLPHFTTLRQSIIHNDLNDQNVLTDGVSITGIIDFGDITYSPLICELAIALTYCMMDKADPVKDTVDIIRGYQTIIPLTESELNLLYYIIPARVCVSVCSSAEAKANNEATEHVLIDEARGHALLEQWISISPIWAKNQFLKTAGYPVSPIVPVKNSLVKSRNNTISSALKLSYDDPVYMTSAAFQYMFDEQGNTYLDAYNNIPLVGHCHPRISEAISRQTRLLNTNTRYLYQSLTDYSEKLLGYFPDRLNKVFLVNSGSAATDLAIRITKEYTSKNHFLVLEHGYHGNTGIAINLSAYKFDCTGGAGQADEITTLRLPGFYKGDFNTAEEYVNDAISQIDNLIAGDIHPAAMIVEPISGCGGQVPLAPGYLKGLKPFLEKHNILLIADEVQTGFARLGEYFWGFEMHDVVPDMVILGKPMGNGHPIGGVVTTETIADAFDNGMEFFSSFGGNPVSCEVAKAVLEVIEEEGLQENARIVGDYFKTSIEELQMTVPYIGDVRGQGLFLGIELEDKEGKPATLLTDQVINDLRKGFILSSTDGPYNNVVKVKPPLCFSKSNVDQFVAELASLLK